MAKIMLKRAGKVGQGAVTAVKYSLPEEPSVPASDLWANGILIYGEKKLGKTSLCSMFPNAFFMMAEPGAKSFEVYQKPVLTWEAFKGYVALLEKDKRFEVVVVDPVDRIYKLCMMEVCKKLLIDHPSEEEWGKGWEAIKDEFIPWINRLMSCGKGVVWLSHSIPKEIKTRKGDTYHRIGPSMPGQAWGALEGIIDLWIYMCFDDDGERTMVIRGNDHVGAGHNLEGHFLYTDGSPIETIPMGKSKEEAYKNFTAAFKNELVKPKSKPETGGGEQIRPRKKIVLKKKS